MFDLSGKRVTVAGLGRFGGGIAVSRWLLEQGARVTVTDIAAAGELSESVKQLAGLPIEFHLGGNRIEDFTNADLVVASPALPPTSAELQSARAAGVPITTEIRLFAERCPARIIGVTGTKGKSTTTALLGRMLSTRQTTWVGGNIGVSLLPDLPRIEKSHLVVLELSSYMLHYLGQMEWSPHVAVITMLAADHLDWHGSAEAYLAAKSNLMRYQRPDDLAVLNHRDARCRELAARTPARIIWFGDDRETPIPLLLPGEHNQHNAQAALAAAMAMGVSRADAVAACADFPGLPHRLELVCERDGVRYFNDSIATVPEAAIAALEAFPPRRVIQIVGGKEKGVPLTALCNALAERAKAALCIGSNGHAIVETLSSAPLQGGGGGAMVYDCGDLTTAMKVARTIVGPGDMVLLSPGCASYDQFANFMQRGELFAQLARDVKNDTN
ncbi:MAG TPA: UDP-N-acetylmuramoyl-L-alanine--D-glutamate ligase [Tepidisphaeraceae bacterium]|nr:UDP-N-acetylmuramoyl-L-alanine--D-glutamate ligase [Tepidisphaeraceae bacterium]